MDLSTMSDADLDAMIAKKQSSGPDLSSLTDEDLDDMIRQKSNKQVVEEMHPGFSDTDRFVVKNLANDPNASLAYLQREHPDMEITTEPLTGRVIAKKPEETEYRVLDPDTGFFSSDIVRDAGDIVFDVGSGVATTAATAAAGLLSGGAAAVPAGALAGAATEGARQFAGKMFGVNDKINMEDVGWAAGAGALSPVLFGTGATAAQIAAKTAGNTAKALNPFTGAINSVRSGVEGAGKAVASGSLKSPFKTAKNTVGGLFRGISATPALDDAGTALMSSQRGVVGRLYDGVKNKVTPKLGALASGIDEDTIRYTRDNLDAVRELEKADLGQYGHKQHQRFKGSYRHAQTKAGEAIEAVIDNPDAVVDISPVKEEFKKAIQKEQDWIGKLASTSEPMAERVEALQAQFDEIFTGIPDQVTARQAWLIKKQLDELAKIRQAVDRGAFANAPASMTQAKLQLQMGAGNTAKKMIEVIDRAVTGPTYDPKLGGLLTAANKRYADVKAAGKSLDTIFGKKNTKTGRKLANLTTESNAELLSDARLIDQTLGTNVAEEAQKMAAVRDFGNASWLAKSSKGTTSTSRTVPLAAAGGLLGYYAGAQSGMGHGGAGVGAGAGILLGTGIGGPAALRRYMQMQRNATKFMTATGNVGVKTGVVPLSIWEAMMNEGTGQ